MEDLIIFVLASLAFGCIFFGFIFSIISSLGLSTKKTYGPKTDLYGNIINDSEPKEKYDDYTDGIDETSNASFTDVVKEVVSDITGKSFENMDDPISGDDDDDPIKFK